MVIYMVNSSTQLSDVTCTLPPSRPQASPVLTHKTGFSIKLGILTVVEGAVIIIASCLITIWPLVIRLTPQRLLCALSGSPPTPRDHEHHQCWYMRTRCPSKSEAALANSRAISTPREQGSTSWYSSHSSFEDLEDQRLWSYEEGDEIRPCGTTAVSHRAKVESV
jgi:hypothetical protein